MSEHVLLQGDGWAIVESDVPRTAVPYPSVGHDEGNNYGFVDLRDRPELAARIPEAQGRPGLVELLGATNAVGSELMSLGCESVLRRRPDPAQEGEPTCSRSA